MASVTQIIGHTEIFNDHIVEETVHMTDRNSESQRFMGQSQKRHRVSCIVWRQLWDGLKETGFIWISYLKIQSILQYKNEKAKPSEDSS